MFPTLKMKSTFYFVLSRQIWAQVYAILAKVNICGGKDGCLNETSIGRSLLFIRSQAVVFAFLDESSRSPMKSHMV